MGGKEGNNMASGIFDKNMVRDFMEQYVLMIFLFIIGVIISTFVPRFLSSQNLVNVMTQIAINALLATGMTFVILTAGIDLSVGSVAALAGIVVTALIKQMPNASVFTCVVVSILVSSVIGGICGGFSAFAIAKLNVAPFIATLAMLSIARGFAFVYTQSRPIFELPETFSWIGWGYIGKIPVIVLIMLLVLIISHIVLDKTCFGRYVYAVGSNEDVAMLSGINVSRIKFTVYVISGMLSAFAGVCLASKLATGQPAAASGYELNAITAVVMGGTSLFGGKGSIFKTIIGIVTIGVINNGLSLMQVSSYWQSITMGFIILVAVAIDQVRNRKK
jgi:ribose transport system permease protein